MMKKIISISIASVLTLYVAAISWPQWYFQHHLVRGPITLHSASPIDERYLTVVDKAIERLKTSALHDPALRFNVHLCNDRSAYAFFAPTARDAFAATYPLMQNIFVNVHDAGRNEVYRPSAEFNVRSLSGTIAHEFTHVMLEDELGPLRYKFLPLWKKEGYCDHVASESSIGTEEGVIAYCNGTLEHEYFRGRLRVEEFLRNGTTEQLLTSRIDGAQLDEALKERLCR